MKKSISALFALILTLSLCLNLTACTGSQKLTLVNYKDYLSFNISDNYTSQSVDVGHWGSQSRKTALSFTVWSNGVSSNFNYNNVTIKVRIYGTYGIADLRSISDSPDSYENFELFVNLNPNISGATLGGVETEKISGNGKAIVSCDYSYEIVSISGTVSPA